MSNFDVLADFYDSIITNRKIDEYYLEIYNKHSSHIKNILDLGCGTGVFLSKLPKITGCLKSGIDSSSEMIEQAKRKNVDSLFLCETLEGCALKEGSFDFIISMYDVINNIITIEGWNDLFKKVHNALKPGGIFAFDVNTEERMNYLSSVSPMLKEFDNNYSITIVTKAADKLFQWNHLLFIFDGNGSYELRKMNLKVYSPSIDEITSMLLKLFLKVDTKSIKQLGNRSIKDKKIFICQKDKKGCF